MTRFLLLLLLLAGCTSLFAQKAIVKGIVSDAKTSEGLLGANVKVGSEGVATELDGSYKLELPAGKHKIEFSFVSFETIIKEVTLTDGQELELNVQLEESETIMGTTTITSSKFEKPLGEVTVSLEVVQPRLLENTNAVSVNEVLDKLPGVNMMEDQVDIRGGAGYAQGTGSRVLMLMDDLPVLQVDAGLPQWRDLPTENISQIEVLKGAASALYGSTAMNGIINIRTAYPTAKPLTKISLSGKYFGSPKDPANKWWTNSTQPYESNLQVAHRQKIGKLDIVAGGNLYNDRSFMRGNDKDTTGGVDTMANFVRAARTSVNLRYRLNDKLFVGLNTTVNVGQQNRHLFWDTWRTNPHGGLYEAASEAIPIRGKYFRVTIDPSVTAYDSKGGRHRVQSRYYHITNNNENMQSNSSDYGYLEYQYQQRFEKLQGLELATGLVGSVSHVSAEVYGNNSFDLANLAAYVQLDKKFFDRLNVSLGVRYELNHLNGPDSIFFKPIQFLPGEFVRAPDTTEGRPVLRVGMNYRLLEGTFLRASWGQAYRFPTIVEKYISTSTGTLGIAPNPTLYSETGWSSELGIKQGFKIGNWQGYLDLVGFWSEYYNMMEFQFVTLFFQVKNVGDTRIRGGEVSIAGQGKIGQVSLDVIGGYNYLDPRYLNFSDSIDRIPIISTTSDSINILKYRSRHSGKIDVQATYKNYSAGFNFIYMSFMENIDNYLDGQQTFPSIRAFRDKPEVQRGTFILNARVSYKYKFAKVSLLGNNLLNSEYWLRPGRLEAPRNIALRFDFNIEGKEREQKKPM
jgi:iron complex outermembrane receptor protein